MISYQKNFATGQLKCVRIDCQTQLI